MCAVTIAIIAKAVVTIGLIVTDVRRLVVMIAPLSVSLVENGVVAAAKVTASAVIRLCVKTAPTTAIGVTGLSARTALMKNAMACRENEPTVFTVK